jgi:hypothetical protein
MLTSFLDRQLDALEIVGHVSSERQIRQAVGAIVRRRAVSLERDSFFT